MDSGTRHFRARTFRRRDCRRTLAFTLPLVGLLSLLLRSQLDPYLESYRAHFVVLRIKGKHDVVNAYVLLALP